MEVEAGDIRSLRLGEEGLHMVAEVCIGVSESPCELHREEEIDPTGSRVGAGTAVVVVHNLHYCTLDTQTY